MAKVNAQEWLDKWGRRLNAVNADMKAGIERVQTAPGKEAAKEAERMLKNLMEAVQSGRWGKAVSSVSLDEWKQAMINKGIPRISQGVTTAQKTKEANIAALLTAVDKAAAAANALPKGGLEESIARATTFMREMSKNAPKKQGKI